MDKNKAVYFRFDLWYIFELQNSIGNTDCKNKNYCLKGKAWFRTSSFVLIDLLLLCPCSILAFCTVFFVGSQHLESSSIRTTPALFIPAIWGTPVVLSWSQECVWISFFLFDIFSYFLGGEWKVFLDMFVCMFACLSFSVQGQLFYSLPFLSNTASLPSVSVRS